MRVVQPSCSSFLFFCHGVVVPVSSSSSCLAFTIVVSGNELAWRQSWSLVPSQSSSLTLGSVSPSQEKKYITIDYQCLRIGRCGLELTYLLQGTRESPA